MPETLLKKTQTITFSREYCKIFKNTYFEEHLRTAASDSGSLSARQLGTINKKVPALRFFKS